MNGKKSEPSADLAELGAEALLGELAERDPFFAEGSAIYDLVGKVSSLLREMRNSARLTQAGLAEKLGVSQGRVSQIESGLADHAPSLEMIARIAYACEVTPQFGFDAGSPSDDKEQQRQAQFAARMNALAESRTQPDHSAAAKSKAVYGTRNSS